VAREETYKNAFVFYDRFVYDLISMFGLHLFYIEIGTLELLIRRLYRAVTFHHQGKVRLRRFEHVAPAFTEDELEKAINDRHINDTKVTLKIDPKLL
jgi:hypothetical protein